jgi:hypothetical protein
METQVAEPPVKAEPPTKTDTPSQVEARDEKAVGPLETVSVGLLVGAALTLLALFRPNRPKRTV